MAPPTAPARRRNATLLLYVIPLAIGAYIGYQLAYTASLGGLSGGLGAALLMMASLGVLLVVTVVAIIAWLWPGGGGQRFARVAFVSAALAVVGGIAGNVLTPAAGLEYREPVTLAAPGTVSLTMETVDSFVARESSAGDCRSVPDETRVAMVTALNLGEVGKGTLRGTLWMQSSDGAGGNEVPLEAWIDGHDLPPESVQPTWAGSAQITQRAADDRSGHATFTDLRLQSDPKLGAPAGDWPPALSGELTWSCAPWAAATGASQDEPAGVELDLEGVDWQPVVDATSTCTTEEGVRRGVLAPLAGRLQGLDTTAELGLDGAAAAGDEVLLTVRLSAKEPPPGQEFVPNWVGRVVLDEVEPDLGSGVARFAALPSGVEPSVGPPPAGWPRTLAGTVAWSCGGG